MRQLITTSLSIGLWAAAASLGAGGCAGGNEQSDIDASTDAGTDTDTDADTDSDTDSDTDGACLGSSCEQEDDGSWSCNGGGCSMFCEGIHCSCDGGGCAFDCTSGAVCLCAGGTCVFECTSGADCECGAAQNCVAVCLGEGTYCCGMVDSSIDEDATLEIDCDSGDAGPDAAL